jgi:serine/threonine-protein kinase HipA
MTPSADVVRGEQVVAQLFRLPNSIGLEYVSTDPGIACHVPYQPGLIEWPELPSFFLNLLPEGARLDLLLRHARSKDDALELLVQVGWDTIGDISVVPHGTPSRSEPAVAELAVEDVSFWELFRQGTEANPDASIPGVQEKISASTVAFGVRLANQPSAILKLNPEQYPRLVQNEFFFLNLARQCGIRVAKAELVTDRDGHTGLLVQRFDRIKSGRSLAKLHQEDACQLLDLPPSRKYYPSLRSVADAVAGFATAPIVEVTRLLELTMFSYLIGNGDLHAKNISLLWNGLVTLSPAYDLLSTLAYPQLDKKMALSMDGRDDNFRLSSFTEFGGRFGIPEVAIRKIGERLVAEVEQAIPRLGEIGLADKETEALQRAISKRVADLKR